MDDRKSGIVIRDLRLQTEDGTVWSDISFSLDSGRRACITGLNAAARTVLMRMIAGLVSVKAGKVLLWNKSIQEIDRRWLSSNVRYISSGVKPGFSYLVEEFISRGCEYGMRSFRPRDDENNEQAEVLMRKLDIIHLARRDCNHLKKTDLLRVHIAQSMMCQPLMLLIDDRMDRLPEDVQDVLLKFYAETVIEGLTVVMTCDQSNHASTKAAQVIELDQTAVLQKAGEAKPDKKSGFIF